MSETNQNGERVSEDDLRHMLEESRGKIEVLTKERDTERSTRVATEQERDAERVARLATEQGLDGATKRIGTEMEQRFTAEKELVKGSIATQRNLAESAEAAYAQHAEIGDWKAAASAQRQIAEAASRLTTLEAKEEYLDANKDALTTPPQQRRQEVAPPAADPISKLINGAIQPREREWLMQRPKFVNDSGYREQVFGASQFATGKGYARGSDAYFREMERILDEGGTRSEARQEPARETREEPPYRQERAPSADIGPQRRPAPGQNPPGGREFRLTPEQAEVADGLYGQPNGDNYIADQAERYRHYHTNLERRRASGRM